MLSIGCDMDGVLADFTGTALRRVKDRWGIEIRYEELKEPRMAEYIYARMSKQQQSYYNNPKDLYKEIAPPGFFEQLDAYEGVIDTFKTLDAFYNIIIITKPLEWNHCPGEKHRWLTNHLGYTPEILMVSSPQAKGMVGVDIMIDDDPRVIKNLNTSVGIMVRRPWNEEFLKFEAVHAVDSFNDTPSIIEKITETSYLY